VLPLAHQETGLRAGNVPVVSGVRATEVPNSALSSSLSGGNTGESRSRRISYLVANTWVHALNLPACWERWLVLAPLMDSSSRHSLLAGTAGLVGSSQRSRSGRTVHRHHLSSTPQSHEKEVSDAFHVPYNSNSSAALSRSHFGHFIMADQCIVCLENLDTLGQPAPPDSGAAALSEEPPPAAPGPTSTAEVTQEVAATGIDNHDNIAVIDICGHILHDSCLREWIGKANSCPICRQSFHLVRVYDKVGGKSGPPHHPQLRDLDLLTSPRSRRPLFVLRSQRSQTSRRNRPRRVTRRVRRRRT
jgi:hypothetical protein